MHEILQHVKIEGRILHLGAPHHYRGTCLHGNDCLHIISMVGGQEQTTGSSRKGPDGAAKVITSTRLCGPGKLGGSRLFESPFVLFEK